MANRARIATLIATSACAVLVLCFGLYLLAIHSLNKAFSQADFSPVGTVAKKVMADVFVLRKRPLQATTDTSLLQSYENDPAAFKADAKLFDAWTSALRIAQDTLQGTSSGTWVRSTADATFLPADRRSDPWNHSVCLLRRGDTVTVVSTGPNAKGSPVCKDIQINEDELNQLPHKKLIQSPSGYLILVLDKHETGS